MVSIAKKEMNIMKKVFFSKELSITAEDKIGFRMKYEIPIFIEVKIKKT